MQQAVGKFRLLEHHVAQAAEKGRDPKRDRASRLKDQAVACERRSCRPRSATGPTGPAEREQARCGRDWLLPRRPHRGAPPETPISAKRSSRRRRRPAATSSAASARLAACPASDNPYPGRSGAIRRTPLSRAASSVRANMSLEPGVPCKASTGRPVGIAVLGAADAPPVRGAQGCVSGLSVRSRRSFPSRLCFSTEARRIADARRGAARSRHASRSR